MTQRGTDAISESLRDQPAALRWLVGGAARGLRLARYLFALQFVGGLAGLLVGAVTLNGTLAASGGGQALLAGLVLALGAMGEGTVEEVRGPQGEFVVRSGRRRLWRERRGVAKLLAFVRGTSDWGVVVRQRVDDPFGQPVLVASAETELTSAALAGEISADVRQGRLSTT